jgi:hypothetical protein
MANGQMATKKNTGYWLQPIGLRAQGGVKNPRDSRFSQDIDIVHCALLNMVSWYIRLGGHQQKHRDARLIYVRCAPFLPQWQAKFGSAMFK